MQTTALGRVLEGRYRLEMPVGAGASAEVYSAIDLDLRRTVAVKLLHRGLAADGQFVSRFLAEARAVAALNHPNIVQIYDWGRDDGQVFLVLEYLGGGSLRDLRQRSQSLAPSEVARIGAQAGRALDFAHQRGFVHRDIKPANLLFDESGDIHVADFGLARAMASAAWTEPLGVVFGTAEYASPEQARGGNLDEKSDVYSLALVCYEALTGELPFTADTPLATLMARITASLPNSPELGTLGPILQAATRPDPGDRLDAASFAELLEEQHRLLPIAPKVNFAKGSKTSMTTAVDVDDTTVIPTHVDLTEAIAVGEANGTVREPKAKKRREHRAASLRPRRRRLRYALAAAVIAVAATVGTSLYVHYGVYGYSVPNLKGATVASARRSISESGLRLDRISRQYSALLPAGEVVAQSVAAGRRIKQGTTINLVVSLGHAPVDVPHLSGLTVAQASSNLRQAGLTMTEQHAYSETVKAGFVISSVPTKGTAAFQSHVAVSISLGPQPRTIPDLAGDPYAQARSDLVGLRLVPKKTVAYSTAVPPGDVISSAPAFGATGIPVGSKVTVVVSRGPQLVVVPNVSGQTIANAVSELKAVGLNVTEVIGPPFADTVSTSDPPAQSTVQPGSSLTLYAS